MLVSLELHTRETSEKIKRRIDQMRKRINVFYKKDFLFSMFEDAMVHEGYKVYGYQDLIAFEHSQEPRMFVILVDNPMDYSETIKTIKEKYPYSTLVVSATLNRHDEIIQTIRLGTNGFFFLPFGGKDIENLKELLGGVS